MIVIARLKTWLANVAIRKKFIPLQIFVIAVVAIISIFSIVSVIMVNHYAENIIDDHVSKREDLNSMIRNMYVCRVLGRDILLQDDIAKREELYVDYLIAFSDLDSKMDNFSNRLSDEQFSDFQHIIDEKNIYKDSMILSADIIMEGGDYDDALYALQIVTPIANDFFGSIDDYLNNEQRLMDSALVRNDNFVLVVLISSLILNIIVILSLILFIKYFSNSMGASLVLLEKSVSHIAETGNMKVEIPQSLYTQDEVGRIALVVDKMKTMLLNYSFTDTLTGGYNVKAYYEELNDLFNSNSDEQEIWCVISDMNNLKMINDTLGHIEGDSAIRKTHLLLNDELMNYGKTFRIGGDEFVSLLTNCPAEVLEVHLKNIVSKIETANAHTSVGFSLAIGYDLFKGSTLEEYHQFFKIVDKKMYDNKAKSKEARLNARVVDIDSINH